MPRILDPAAEAEALTHPGAIVKFGEGSGYERFEWIGDAQIETLASVFIFQTFPKLSPGRMSQLRELCVKNATLSQFFFDCGLDKRAKLPLDFHAVLPDGRSKLNLKEKTKVAADIFEAYVGALIYTDPENGFRRAAEWLKGLWAQVLRALIISEETAAAQAGKADNGPTAAPARRVGPSKDILHSTIGAKGILIEYKDVRSKKYDSVSGKELYTVGCYVTGWGLKSHLLGQGSALNKKQAGQAAAERALENKEMINMMVKKKEELKALLAAREGAEQRGAQGQGEEGKIAEAAG
ncbi:hypothetical protein P8C59_006932 [Phyllachora maydis]|uniref:RNase III domain-containing protein n=1 Tax=Phyllachora maydis TaxID=1825666 RepID=A0AAD9MHF5_9PEZI|nr:hypothetical protein P8C59_006932 [Phyllachora maydis]